MYKFVELWTTCHDQNRIFNNFANHDHLFAEMLLNIAIQRSAGRVARRGQSHRSESKT